MVPPPNREAESDLEPSFTFSPDEPQIAVIIQTGEITGSTLDIVWTRVAAEGEQERLFSHTVEVSSHERAYSIGKNPGSLTTGTYRVVATLEGHSVACRGASDGRGAAVPFPDRQPGTGTCQHTGKRCAPYEAKTSLHVVGPIDMLWGRRSDTGPGSKTRERPSSA